MTVQDKQVKDWLITKDNIHVWNPQNPWTPERLLLSIPEQEIISANNLDDAINIVYTLGYKESAKEIHNHFKRGLINV